MAVHYARGFYEFTKSYQRKTKGIIQKDHYTKRISIYTIFFEEQLIYNVLISAA